MKRINLILLAALGFSLFSCANEELVSPGTGNTKEVEISISTSGKPVTRTPVADLGSDSENIIEELDLLVFSSADRYLYRRQAVKQSTGTNLYRALLQETDEVLTLHLLANSHSALDVWESGGEKTGLSWSQIHAQLIDSSPWTLSDSTGFRPLPMWGTVSGALSTTSAPTQMGTVSMLRSVASIDLYVDQNTKTADFILSDLYAYFAPNKGYLGAIKNTLSADPQEYVTPSDMATSLTNVAGNRLHATKVDNYVLSDSKNYKGIAHQIYLYENPYVSTANGSDKRPTRAIMAGYYKQTGDREDWVKSYYPIDIVFSTGAYHPVIRNWKYEFKVNAVNGPGVGSLEEAATAVNTDLNLDIIYWNKEDVEIGVTGKYYVTMERKKSILWRDAHSTDQLGLTYRYYDEVTDNDFEIHFLNADNGTQEAITEGIQNEYFKVIMTQVAGTGSGSVTFDIEALQDYDADHSEETVVVSYRNLEFQITIVQVDSSEEDWNNGGTIPGEL